MVDTRFVDLLMSRLNETESILKDNLISGVVKDYTEYSLSRGKLEGIQLAKRDIEEIVNQVLIEN
jgi:hypothetical protein|tara:strand:+ start:242 stop:436 length:195 start_codon:yes stop_codon:yes gene_type:complete